MEIVIQPDATAAHLVVANIMESYICGGGRTIGLATGSSPQGVYTELIRRHHEEQLTFAQCQAFLLDEYVGLPRSHPQSYYSVIRSEFIDHIDIDPERVYSPDGNAPDLWNEGARYDAAIAAAGG